MGRRSRHCCRTQQEGHVTITHMDRYIIWINISCKYAKLQTSVQREPLKHADETASGPSQNVPTKCSELPKGSGSCTLPSSLGALPKHLGRLIPTESTTPHTALLLILVRAITSKCHQHPTITPTTTKTHKLALAALTSVASSL